MTTTKNWEQIQAALLYDLNFQDGVEYDKPAWVNKENTAIVYHCSEGGFGVLIMDEDGDDGTWGETLEDAIKNAEIILNLE
jgi:hypothetical protein